MVDSKRYDPTITRFRKHTQSFVSNKTKKGHLNNNERDGDVIVEKGTLVNVSKKNISGNGWKVKVGNKEIMCNYGDNIVYLPEYTETAEYYVPKYQCEVEVRIDSKSGIKTITRINDPNKKQIQMYNDSIRLRGGGDASLTISSDSVSINGDIEVKTSEDNDLPDTISLTEMYQDIEVLKSKLSDNNDS